MRTFLVAIFAILYVLLAYPLALFCWILSWFNKRACHKLAYHAISGGCLGVKFLSGSKVEVIGRENIPQGGAMFAANHRSYLDIFFSHPLIPAPCSFLAKKQLAMVFPLAPWFPLAQVQLVDRDNPRQGLQVIKKSVDLLQKGYNVFVFPEGTRGHVEGEFGEFKHGSFKMALRANAPIVPVTIIGSAAGLEDNGKFKITPTHCKIIFDKPVDYTTLSPEDQKDLGVYIRNIIVKNYNTYKDDKDSTTA